jgi:hypothetical protein
MEGMSSGGGSLAIGIAHFSVAPLVTGGQHTHVSAAPYPVDNSVIIDIGLRVIKHCGMYAKEYKNWISRKNAVPHILETINFFKE